MRSRERKLRFIKINTIGYNIMSLDLRLVNCPCWGELEKDENIVIENDCIVYKAERCI